MDTESLGAGRFESVEFVAQTGSTNADLVDAAGTDPQTPRVLIADEQTAGRGRHDRTWTMPPGGGLLLSFYVPWADRDAAHIVPTSLGNAAIAAITSVVALRDGGSSIGLKWPNDIVDDQDRKLGGMLSSAVVVDGQFAGVVVGLGINVTWPLEAQPDLPDAAALVSLLADGVDGIDRQALAAELIKRFDRVLGTAETYGVVPVHDRYRRQCLTLGSTVTVHRADGDITGLACDIDPNGALIIDIDGRQQCVDVGDVIHVRPSGTSM